MVNLKEKPFCLGEEAIQWALMILGQSIFNHFLVQTFSHLNKQLPYFFFHCHGLNGILNPCNSLIA